MRTSISFYEKEVLSFLYDEPSASYDTIAAVVACERSTAIIAVKRLERRKMIGVQRGNGGRVANFYTLSDPALAVVQEHRKHHISPSQRYAY